MNSQIMTLKKNHLQNINKYKILGNKSERYIKDNIYILKICINLYSIYGKNESKPKQMERYNLWSRG